MNDVRTIQFKNFITLQRGFDLPKNDMIEGSYPVVGSTSIIGYHSEYKIDPPGVVTGRSGSLGSVQYMTTKYWPHNTALWVKDFKGNHPRYVYYYLKTIDLKRFNSGAGVPTLNRNDLDTLEIKIHGESTQRKIASILSAYDDLIENNTRRIKILEEMAQTIYREWFVEFRAPGVELREATPEEQKLTGKDMFPKGWEVKELFDMAKVNYGKNLPTKNLTEDGPYPVYGAAKIIGWHTEYTRERRTIICGCRGSVGEMSITQPQCFVTNNSFVFDPTHADNFFWLFHSLKERGLRDVIGGAAQPQITLEGISSVELVTPTLPLRTRYQQVVSAMFEQAWVLESQIKNLRCTRDLLLPKLISGEVGVEGINIVVGD